MLQINVNRLSRAGASGPENWGELLNLLEHGDGADRHVVTAVRFGGVAEPTFREPSALARAIHDLGDIEIESSTLDELLHESAQAAYDSIGPLRNATRRIAERLRAGNMRTAARDLPALTASVQSLTNITTMLAEARASVGSHRTDFDALVLRLCTIVDGIIARQSSGQWALVADVLDTELAPTFAAWTSVVRQVWTV